MMKRFYILFLVLFACVSCYGQRKTSYYKLIKITIGSSVNTNVKGGQFVTFLGQNKCYESNDIGISEIATKLTSLSVHITKRMQTI